MHKRSLQINNFVELYIYKKKSLEPINEQTTNPLILYTQTVTFSRSVVIKKFL